MSREDRNTPGVGEQLASRSRPVPQAVSPRVPAQGDPLADASARFWLLNRAEVNRSSSAWTSAIAFLYKLNP